jgi:hypothetical protein
VPFHGIACQSTAGKRDGKASTAADSKSMTSLPLNAGYPTQHSLSGGARLTTGTTMTSQPGYIPPHILTMNRSASISTAQRQPPTESLIDLDVQTRSSVSNPYEDAWSSVNSVGPWSVVDTRRRNAIYEPQRAVEERTQPTPTPAPAPAPAPAQTSRRGNWAKPVSSPD